MTTKYLIEVSEKHSLLIQGRRVNGNDKILINDLFKKDGQWNFGKKNISIPFEDSIIKQIVVALIDIAKEDPKTFEEYITSHNEKGS